VSADGENRENSPISSAVAKKAKSGKGGYQMNKWFPVAVVVVLSLAMILGVACGGGGEEEEGGVKEVKLGIGAPLSGVYGSAVGIPAKQGMELANDYIGEFTVDGQSYKWDLIFEDSGVGPDGGVASATKLIVEDGVKIMTQVYGDPGLAAQPICEESGVILFLTAQPMEAFGPDKPYTFLGVTPPELPAAILMKYISEAHPEVKTASAITDDTVTGRIALGAMSVAAEHFGIEWLETEYYPPGTTEFYPIATKMVSKDPDLCYVNFGSLQPMREMGWEGISFYSLWYTAYAEQVGWDNIVGHLCQYPEPYGEDLPELVKEMAAEYQQRHNVEFSLMPFYYAIQLYYLTAALEKAGTVDDVDQIIATLETETFDTPIGPVWFGFEELYGIGHTLVMPCWIGEIRDREYQRVFEMSTEEADALTLEIFGK